MLKPFLEISILGKDVLEGDGFVEGLEEEGGKGEHLLYSTSPRPLSSLPRYSGPPSLMPSRSSTSPPPWSASKVEEGGRRREKEGEGGGCRRWEKVGEGGRRWEKVGEGGRRREEGGRRKEKGGGRREKEGKENTYLIQHLQRFRLPCHTILDLPR
jgi:hypothetical protein